MQAVEQSVDGDVDRDREADAPDASSLYFEAVQVLERLHRHLLDVVKAELDREGCRDLTAPQALLIFNLRDGETSAGELRERGNYQGSNVSYNLKKLAECGYLHYTRREDDRRSVTISLTPEGNAVAALIERMWLRHVEGVGPVAGIENGDLQRAGSVLARLERFWTDSIRYRL